MLERGLEIPEIIESQTNSRPETLPCFGTRFRIAPTARRAPAPRRRPVAPCEKRSDAFGARRCRATSDPIGHRRETLCRDIFAQLGPADFECDVDLMTGRRQCLQGI